MALVAETEDRDTMQWSERNRNVELVEETQSKQDSRDSEFECIINVKLILCMLFGRIVTHKEMLVYGKQKEGEIVMFAASWHQIICFLYMLLTNHLCKLTTMYCMCEVIQQPPSPSPWESTSFQYLIHRWRPGPFFN